MAILGRGENSWRGKLREAFGKGEAFNRGREKCLSMERCPDGLGRLQEPERHLLVEESWMVRAGVWGVGFGGLGESR